MCLIVGIVELHELAQLTFLLIFAMVKGGN